MSQSLLVVEHALIAHYLGQIRDQETALASLRLALSSVTNILILEATSKLPLESYVLKTPMEETEGLRLTSQPVFIPILRAGLAMLSTALTLFPSCTVGFSGQRRDELTAKPETYYLNLPVQSGSTVILLDPMLATGGTAAEAITEIKKFKPAKISLVCLIASPEGVASLSALHPDVDIYTAALDRELSAKKYILPGLGDAGDRWAAS